MSNIIDSIQLSGTTYQIQGSGGGGEGTVSALTETNPTLLKADYSIYFTASTIDTIYVMVKTRGLFMDSYLVQGTLSSDDYFQVIGSGNENGITSISASTAFTSTITDGIAEIKFVSPLSLKQVTNTAKFSLCYYFPPTPYTSGSTSEVVEGAVYDSLRKLSLDVLQKDGINDYYIYATDNGIGFNLETDKNNYNGNLALASPTINFNNSRINTQFSSTTASQTTLNTGNRNYCDLFSDKSYDEIIITFNPSYNGSYTTTSFNIYAVDGQGQESSYKRFKYSITNNSISWNTTGWDTYFTVVDTLSTDYKLKIVANTGYKISQFRSLDCLIGGIDAYNPNQYITNLVTATSNIHDGQEVIDDLYANKQDKLSAGTGINITDNVISATGGGGGNPTVELTQAEYDALVTAGTVQADTYYIITDAQAGDLTNYYTKTETNTLLGGKADTATTYTKTEVDNAITAATSTKQDTLVSGTNIKTINNESILGSGNIDIQGGGGGGKAIEAGRGITVTTGETADTVSINLPISASTGTKSIIENSNGNVAGYMSHAEGSNTIANGGYSHAEGSGTIASGQCSHAEGSGTIAGGIYSHAEGQSTIALNESEHASGQYNVSNTGETDADKTLFSVGNGDYTMSHNAFEIRLNGDIYITSGGTDIKLQDNLGGGGSSYSAGTGIDITNNVISVNSGVVTTDTAQDITAKKTIIGEQMLDFKQINDATKLGFTFRDTGGTEISSFQYRPNTISGRTMLALQDYQGTASSTRTHNYIGFRHYDNRTDIKAAYTLSTPLPEDAKTPFGLTTSYQHFFFPMGFKNGSTMIKTDNTGVVDLSSELGGLKLKKLTQAEYDALASKDNSTLYVIVN